jgi:hypothetical protein
MSDVAKPMNPLLDIARGSLLWAAAWGALGSLWMFGGPSTGDVMGGSEMWPLVMGAGVLLGAAHGAVYAALRRWVIVDFNADVLRRRRIRAGIYGMFAAGVPWLIVQPGLALFLAILGFLTAAAFPGRAPPAA